PDNITALAPIKTLSPIIPPPMLNGNSLSYCTIRAYIPIMANNNAIWTMQKDWRCFENSSCIQIGPKRTKEFSINSFYPEQVVKPDQVPYF
ncbi:MAG: hypothetical protein K2M17_04760, partial [Bacilli bacterium]|nr:hypothetical protein [Bacilli bacterium]